jgi:hypothetical protein
MARLRLLIKMESADAYELKAQALNNDPRLKQAGIAALKFAGDRQYLVDGEFSSELPAEGTTATQTEKQEAGSGKGKRLRVVVRMANADSYELKAKALNKDTLLKKAGIAALKFVGDKRYLVDGEFSTGLLPAATPETGPGEPKVGSTIGKRLRVVVRMANADAYELKAQALNDDPRLKEAGISALKFIGDSQYIVGGGFSPDVPAATTPDKKLRVVLRTTPELAYELVARALNGDPKLAAAGIAGIDLAKGAGMVPLVKEAPRQPAPPKKKRSFARVLLAGLAVAFIGVIGASALFLLPAILNPPPAPVATGTSEIVPITGPLTSTNTPLPPTVTLVPPTATKPASTRTQRPTATFTLSPTLQVVSCQAPKLGTVIPGSLNCRYGPGENYLYEYGLYQGDQVPILGRQETANQGTWVYVHTESQNNIDCWVNAKQLQMDAGDVACLDNIYPETGGRPIYRTDLFPPPRNVEASRSGNLVFISWTGFDLKPGDWEGGDRPRYLLELWTCQGGKLVFTPMGTLDTFASIADEGGCAEKSHGQVFMAHVDGYIGPAEIPWPP